MEGIQNITQRTDILNINAIYPQLMNDIMLNKIEQSDHEMRRLTDRIEKLEQNSALWTKNLDDSIFAIGVGKTTALKQPAAVNQQDSFEECKLIAERAIELLTEWEKSQNIKAQIQYGAVIVKKIENLKKKEWIQSDDARKKICTLLRNVIRLNITDDVFTDQQIKLLKRGFSFLISNSVQKEDMLQLNRELRDEKLMTMLSWE